MNNLIDWEYYNSHFPKVKEERFNQLSYRAERMVLKKLNTDNFGEYEDDVKDCICCVINALDIHEKSNGITSTSNDGYSESYANSTSEENKQAITDIVYEWLGDSGLIKSGWIAL